MRERAQHSPPSFGLAATLLVLLPVVVGCGGPLGPLPGGELSGAEVACPRAFPADVREIEIEVRPDDPYSVTTWNVVQGGRLYIPADFLNPVKRWPYFLEADPRIRIRTGALVYACQATRVEDADTIDRLRLAAAKKYDLDPEGAAASTEVWWFTVSRR